MRISILAKIARCASLAAFCVFLGIYSSSARADCYSEQERLITQIQEVMNKMGSGQGFCGIARQIKYEYPQYLDFYNRCPIVDPDGSMRNHIREMLSWADQVEASACN